MNSLLSKLGYSLDLNTHVWLKTDCQSIAYNDGDEVENRITAAIAQAKDITLFSPELKKQCVDWPSLYHLSASRANILRPFQSILSGADVLEIGSGCGAITRYLGECGAHVLALEGTLRRAAITRSRTRDLNHVTVVCEQFHQFAWNQKFDVITLIGVLEYANLFMPGACPVHTMLQHVKSMLKPEGRLIIAIENQLGLKYFAGAPEDHHGQPLYGIEGRYKGKQPTTYGRHILKNHLIQAGFIENHFFAPFPDYKLPLSIISQRGFSSQEFDVEMLVTHSVRADPQLPPHLVFSPELVWPVVLKNELALDLANSFLIVAQTSKTKLPASEVLAYHYSTYRAKIFCKETLFLQTKKGTIEVQSNLLESRAFSNLESEEIVHTLEGRSVYLKGKLLSCDFIDIVTRDGWCIDEVASFFKNYLSIVASLSAKINPIKEIDIDALFPGNSIDLIPQNIIIDQNGAPRVIDQEWAWKSSIPAGFLIFRSILMLNNMISCYGKTQSAFPKTLLGLFLAVYKEMGFEISEEKIQSYYELETLFQCKVAQDNAAMPDLSTALPSSNLNCVITDYRNHIQNIEKALIDKDNHIRNLEYMLKEKEVHIENLDHNLGDKENHIRNLAHMLEDKDRHIEHLDHSVVVKEEHIKTLAHMLKDKDRHIEHLDHGIVAKEEHIKILAHMLKDKDRHIEHLDHSDVAKEEHMKRLAHMLEDKDRHIEHLDHSDVAKEEHMKRLAHMLEAKDRHIEYLDHNDVVKEEHMKRLAHMLEDKDRHIENLEHLLLAKDRKILFLQQMVESFKKMKIVRLIQKTRKKIFHVNPIEICSKSVFFDAIWYLENYPDVKNSGLDPVIHYVNYGAAEKRDPGPNFSTVCYLEENPHIEKMGINPLVHFETQKNS